MIARPRVAGPDGSLRGRINSGHIDWDDREAVECIVEKLHHTLESTMQSYDLQNQQQRTSATENAANGRLADDKVPTIKFIRSVTVVEGRGFYTYCNGPPCPFLRVEYYDPQVRWKVKMLLERGLEVPRSFHPDPRQYDRNDTDEDLLKFHCYEAHIPYTMQFFKDWNLAGMSYIHVRAAKIRGKVGTFSREYYSQKARDSSIAFHENDVFLPSNTPALCLWEADYNSSDKAETLAKRTKKISSCDVEMDCSVNDILNRDSVIKTMLEEEKDEIHWRAVPSLQEIWKEERDRMRRLLGAQHELVSKPLSLTLNVKKDALRPGARPARRGMQKLVQVTHGLEDDFNRSLSDILNRHIKAIQETDEQQAILRQQNEARREEFGLTPTLDDAVGALEFLAADNQEAAIETSAIPDANGAIDENWLLSPSQNETELEPLSFSCSQDMHNQELTSTQDSDPVAYSQRIDQGSSVIEGIDDAIDPETLLPYRELAFGNDTCRAIFEVETDPPGRKRVCGGNRYCSRFGHQDALHRAKPRYYTTVTTGTFVDGILFQSSLKEDANIRNDHQSLSEDELSEDEEELMRDLIATQIPDDEPSARRTVDMSRFGASMTPQPPRLAQRSGTQATATASDTFLSTIEASDDDSNSEVERTNATEDFQSSSEVAEPTPSEQSAGTLHQSGANATKLPPTRAALLRCAANEKLYHMPSKGGLPNWLGHSGRYASLKKVTCMNDGMPQGATLASFCRGHSVHPVVMPPTRGKVVAWQKKRGATELDQHVAPASKRERKMDQNLEIDSNSRKVVPSIKLSASEGENKKESTACQQDVEEVEWVSSQAQLTPSQSSQNDFDALEIDGSTNSVATKPVCTKPIGSLTLSSDSGQNSSACCESHRSDSVSNSGTQNSNDALDGIGQQGGRIHIQGGGGLKTRTKASQTVNRETEMKSATSGKEQVFGLPSPVSFMSIEIHVQCRTGYSRLDAETKIHKKIALTSNPRRKDDKVAAIVYIHGRASEVGFLRDFTVSFAHRVAICC
eukprot:scaffold1169_cov120-Cylindrotheca_fusiformis.AAC.11